MGRLARKRVLRKGFTPCLVCGMAQALPYPAGTFQQVVSTFPSEYIADPQTLMEIYRVLAPDGEAVLLLLAWITDKHWYGRLAAWLFRLPGRHPELGRPAPRSVPADRFSKQDRTITVDHQHSPDRSPKETYRQSGHSYPNRVQLRYGSTNCCRKGQ